MDLLREDVIKETLDALVAILFDTGEASDWFYKKPLTSSSFMAPIVKFVQRKTDNIKADKITILTKASKDGTHGSHRSIWQDY